MCSMLGLWPSSGQGVQRQQLPHGGFQPDAGGECTRADYGTCWVGSSSLFGLPRMHSLWQLHGDSTSSEAAAKAVVHHYGT